MSDGGDQSSPDGGGWTRRSLLGGAALAVGALAGSRSARSAPAAPSFSPPLDPIPLAEPIPISELPTPALLVDLDPLESNLKKAADTLAKKEIGLRPHTKTHKCPVLAKRQLELGAVGICTAKVSEAEVMVEAGIDTVLITSPVVTVDKIRRVVALAEKAPGLQIVIDQEQNARDFAEAAAAAGIRLAVLIGLDTGTKRTGIPPGEPALALAETVARLPALRLDGLQAYAGHVMHVVGHEERRKRSRAALEPCLETKAMLERRGFEIGVMTGGGTGTWDIDDEVEGMTDLQLGSYLFMDVQYRAIGDSDSELFDDFLPSLSVLATAISQPSPDRITVDAGYKAFANEPEAKPRFRSLDGLEYYYGGDEHGIVAYTGEERTLRLGQKAELLVSHCDPTVNLYDVYHPHRDGLVRELWPVSARGRSQ